MANGDSGVPPPGRIPDEPPPYIEGPAGGPAMPTAAPWPKDEAVAYHNSMATMAGLSGIAAGAVLIASAGAAGWLIVGVLLGALAVVTGLEADKISDIARDPPKPHEKPVVFIRRVSRPPGRSDPAAGPIGLPIQYGVAALVTMQGLLDALERSEGARAAGDIDWAVAHAGVARIAGRTLKADLAYQGWALAAAAGAVRGRREDVTLAANDVKPLTALLGDQSALARLRQACKDSGLTDAEVARGLDYLKHVKPPDRAMRVSDALASCGHAIHALSLR